MILMSSQNLIEKFIYSLSHDMRAPVASVQGMITLRIIVKVKQGIALFRGSTATKRGCASCRGYYPCILKIELA
jgi:signal transduction histidine kinase